MTAGRSMRSHVGGGWAKTMHARRQALIRMVAPVFVEHGYESSTMSMLALAAGVTKATFYSDFSD